MKKILTKENIESFQAQCHEHGLRITPQRVAIYKELYNSSDHPTAEQLHKKVRKKFPSISLNTVNETLLTFSHIGFSSVVEGLGSARRHDPNLEAHHHIHCSKCHKIFDFNDKKLNQIKPPAKIASEFKIESIKVVITGICAKCKKKK